MGRDRRIIPHWVFGLLALAALAAAVAHFAEIEAIAQMARQARPLWLLAALALQAETYIALALGWRMVLRLGGYPLTLRQLLPVTLQKLFADQALPSAGLGGHVLLVDRLVGAGVPRAEAVAVMLFEVLGYYAAYAALALATLGLLWTRHEASPYFTVPVSLLLGLAVAIPAGALWLSRRGARPLPPLLARIHPLRSLLLALGEAPPALLKNKGLLARVTLANAAVFLGDSLTLACCLAAVGQGFRAEVAFIAFIMASIAATLSLMPLGLGSFEAASAAVLSLLGLRIEPALTATLLLRGLTTWAPMLPGFVALRKTGRKGRRA